MSLSSLTVWGSSKYCPTGAGLISGLIPKILFILMSFSRSSKCFVNGPQNWCLSKLKVMLDAITMKWQMSVLMLGVC